MHLYIYLPLERKQDEKKTFAYSILKEEFFLLRFYASNIGIHIMHNMIDSKMQQINSGFGQKREEASEERKKVQNKRRRTKKKGQKENLFTSKKHFLQ